MNLHWLLRGIHALVILVTMTAVGTLVFGVAASVGLLVRQSDTIVSWICSLLPWLIVLASAWGAWKRLRYSITLPLLGISGALLGYMAWDDPVRTPPPKIGPIVSADSKSYAAYRRLLKTDAATQSPDQSSRPTLPAFPGAITDWPAFVTEHRAQLENARANDPAGYSWMDDMARNEPEGLYPPPTLNSPGLHFSRIRLGAQMRWAEFHLHIADEKPDEAVQSLLPLLRASYNLQRADTTLVNQMIAVVLIKGCYQRLELIADDPAFSRTARQDILVTLNEAPPMTLVFANAFIGEAYVARSSMETIQGNHLGAAEEWVKAEAMLGEGRDLPPLLTTLLGRLLFNPNRTEREYFAYLNRSCELLQNRHLDRSSELAAIFEDETLSWRLKNPVGKLFTAMVLPAFQKVGEAFWQAEDKRTALIKRLQL